LKDAPCKQNNEEIIFEKNGSLDGEYWNVPLASKRRNVLM